MQTRFVGPLSALVALLFAVGACVPAGTGGGSGSGGSGGLPPLPDMASPTDDGSAEPEPDAAPEPEPDAAPDPEPDAAPDPEPDPETVTVATFNVRRFFDTVCDSGRCGFDEYERQYPQAEFDARAETVAYGVRTLDADIVLLQEIESEACLDALTERLGDRYPVAVIGELGFAASLDVVVLARGGLVRVVRNADERIPRPSGGTTTFSRELLEVHLDVDGRSVIVVNGHYKAKNNDDPDRRLAEAQATRRILDDVAERRPDSLIVFGGDLNDTPGSPPLDALESGGDWLRVAAELGDDAATYEWNGRMQAIDHLYLLEAAAGRYVPGSAEVVRDNASGLARSDHAGLRATFELP